jgi:hypothetical protein
MSDDDYSKGYNDCAKMFLSHPPGDWRSFGSSIDPVTGKAPDYELEFAGKDEGGDPLWERPKPQPRTVSAEQHEALRDGVQRLVDGWPLAPSTTLRVLRALLAEAGEVPVKPCSCGHARYDHLTERLPGPERYQQGPCNFCQCDSYAVEAMGR